MNPLWKIRMLGGLEATRDDVCVTHFGTRKAATLLAYLALFADRAHPREVLAERLWPDEDTDVTRDRFRQALASVRRLLEPPGTAPGSIVQADRATVRFASGLITSDAVDFERTLAGVRGKEPDGRASALAAAVDLYAGELLPGFYEDWIVLERERLVTAYLSALVMLGGLRSEQERPDDAIDLFRRAIAVDALCERAHLGLMQVYASVGRLSEGVRQYQTLETGLREQLQAAPSPEAKELLLRLRSSDSHARSANEAGSNMSFVGWSAMEPEGGAVPLESESYLMRPADYEFQSAIARRDSIVLVKGARQMGKTSLLARGLQRARQTGQRIVLTDLQKFTAAQLASADSLFFVLAEAIAEQLELAVNVDLLWQAPRGWNVKFERFLRREVLGALNTGLVWAIDEADRLFGRDYCAEVFGLFRSWHNERSLNPDGPWSGLTLAIAYSTEAHLFITDLNQSPFNVGTRLALDDFDLNEVSELNRREGSPLGTEADLARFFALVGGHPYLVRRGLHAIAAGSTTLASLEQDSVEEHGIYSDHLHRMLADVSHDAAPRESLRDLLHGRPITDSNTFYRLRSAGLIRGRSEREAKLRCGLYAAFLRRALQ